MWFKKSIYYIIIYVKLSLYCMLVSVGCQLSFKARNACLCSNFQPQLIVTCIQFQATGTVFVQPLPRLGATPSSKTKSHRHETQCSRHACQTPSFQLGTVLTSMWPWCYLQMFTWPWSCWFFYPNDWKWR